MNKKYLNIFIISLLVSLFLMSSCEYQKIKKLKDPKLKFEAAEKYFQKEKYAKALPLYDDIYLITKGTKIGVTCHYRMADTYYKMKDYIIAGYYFRKYVETYPNTEFTEDAQYMSAYCYYLDAPKTKLDQATTITALQEFELFISKYPKSPKIAECNATIDKLREKLEIKSFDNAKLYYNIGYYEAASIALKNSLNKYPDSKLREETYFYILKSDYKYAENSVAKKQKERYQKVVSSYNKFMKKYPNSEFKAGAENILKQANKKLEKLSKKPKV